MRFKTKVHLPEKHWNTIDHCDGTPEITVKWLYYCPSRAKAVEKIEEAIRRLPRKHLLEYGSQGRYGRFQSYKVLRNYELEGRLNDFYGTRETEFCIDEPCPFNGYYCWYHTLHGFENGVLCKRCSGIIAVERLDTPLCLCPIPLGEQDDLILNAA